MIMKKLTLALSFVLGLFSITNTQAQMRIYNSNLVKFGDVNTSPTLSAGFEVIMPKFLFKGNSIEYIFGMYSLVIKNNLLPNTQSIGDSPNIVGGPTASTPGIIMLGGKNQFEIGNTSQPLHSIYSNQLYSSSGGVSTISDRRYKTNIVELNPSSDPIMRLRPVKFDYREEKDGERSTDPRRLNRVGLIAQELKDVIPEAVYYLEEDDIYTVDYTVLIPFLIKTAQE